MNPLLAALAAKFKASGLTQRALEKKSGHSNASISLWLHGRCEPRLSSFENLANSLGYDVVLVERKVE